MSMPCSVWAAAAMVCALALAAPAMGGQSRPGAGGGLNPARQWEGFFPGPEDLAKAPGAGQPHEVRLAQPLPPELQVSLTLPDRHWRQVRGQAPAEGRMLATYVSPRGMGGGYLDVIAFRPPVEVDAADWLMVLAQQEGIETLRHRRLAAQDGGLVELLGIRRPEGQPAVVVRAAVVRSGEVFFLVRAQAPTPAFQSQALDFAAVLYRFKPLNSEPARPLGQWRTDCLGQAACFRVPAYLKGEEQEQPGGGRVLGYKVERGGKTLGRLQLELLPPPPAGRSAAPGQALAFLQGRLKQQGASFGRCAAMPFAHQGFDASAASVSCPPAEPGGLALMAMAVAASPRPVVAWMTLPPRMADAWGWMQCKAIYQAMSQSLSPREVKLPPELDQR